MPSRQAARDAPTNQDRKHEPARDSVTTRNLHHPRNHPRSSCGRRDCSYALAYAAHSYAFAYNTNIYALAYNNALYATRILTEYPKNGIFAIWIQLSEQRCKLVMLLNAFAGSGI